jgi:hypothetical protein
MPSRIQLAEFVLRARRLLGDELSGSAVVVAPPGNWVRGARLCVCDMAISGRRFTKAQVADDGVGLESGIGHRHAHEDRHTAVSIMSSNGIPPPRNSATRQAASPPT